MPTLIAFNKPYGVLTQFTDPAGGPTLADYIPIPHVYAAGRLDRDSEGLLLLTDDGRLQQQLSAPRFKLPKTYWVQVEGEPDETVLARLRRGVSIQGRRTRSAEARIMAPPPVWERSPPIRVRRAIPTSWLEITLTEGRNRQVRRMTAAVGHPTLRLIRYAIGLWTLDGLAPGQWRELQATEHELLHDLETERHRGRRRRTERPFSAGGRGSGRRPGVKPAGRPPR